MRGREGTYHSKDTKATATIIVFLLLRVQIYLISALQYIIRILVFRLKNAPSRSREAPLPQGVPAVYIEIKCKVVKEGTSRKTHENSAGVGPHPKERVDVQKDVIRSHASRLIQLLRAEVAR